jgi:hypothetical protein
LDIGCPDCTTNHAAAMTTYNSDKFVNLYKQLGITLTLGKGFAPVQRGDFTSLCLKTVS